MPDPVADPDDAPVGKPYIRVEFDGELSANITLEMDKVSAAMLWAAGAMITQYAVDTWTENRLRQEIENQMREQAAARPSGLVPVRGTLDHLRKGN